MSSRLLVPRPEEDDGNAEKGNEAADDVPAVGDDAIKEVAPREAQADEDSAIHRIHPAEQTPKLVPVGVARDGVAHM